MTLNGQDIENLNDPLTINLADDYADVSGFGQPITKTLAKKMCQDYCDDYDSILSLLSDVEGGTMSSLDDLKQDERYSILKNLLSAEKHIISGVFGKEILLQILAQKTCEGIRYIIGKDQQGKITVILLGVKEAESGLSEPYDEDPTILIRRSEPVAAPISASAFNARDPLFGEVHKSGKTVAQIESMIQKPSLEGFRIMASGATGKVTKADVLFGEY